MKGAVQGFVEDLWGIRGGRVLHVSVENLGRALAEAVVEDLRESESYDPENDRRVLWAREVIRDMRKRPGFTFPKASPELEACMETMLLPGLRPCGKDLAAGAA